MNITEDELQLYWMFLRKERSARRTLNKGFISKEIYTEAMKRAIQDLELKEPIEQLLDEDYLTYLAHNCDFNEESASIISPRAKARAEKMGDVNPRYACLTDIAKRRNSSVLPSYSIQSWFRSHGTIEFLTLWEQGNNPNYNPKEFEISEIEASKSTLTLKNWIARTGAIGITSMQGRYGGTYAHPAIALDFEAWLSPKFRLTLFQGLHIVEQVG